MTLAAWTQRSPRSRQKECICSSSGKNVPFGPAATPGFVPSYVTKDGRSADKNYCIATIWEKTTADHMIRVLQQIALRYKDNPNFLGIDLEETSMGSDTVQANKNLYYTYYDQLKRTATAVHSAAPNLLFNQELNWPVNSDVDAFYKIADNLVAMGGGGALGWPDSIPKQAFDMTKGGLWYQVGRAYNRKLAIIPYVQAAAIDSSISTADSIYNFLVNDIQAHMIVWAQWHKDMGDAYFTNVVIPTVNKYKGSIKNATCPFR